jgi:hypothetical protein
VNDPNQNNAELERLREAHIEVDAAVVEAYGWTDLALEHGFYPTRHGTWFTVAPATQEELLERLLEINHARYAEELRLGLREPPKAKKSPGARAKAGGHAAPIDSDVQGDLLAGIAPAVPTKKRKS